LANTIPERPPKRNIPIKPIVQTIIGSKFSSLEPKKVIIHVNTFIPVGTPIIIVAAVK
jgi:hypothetical protein